MEHKSQYFLDLKQEEKLKQLFSDATFPELLASGKQESLGSDINVYVKSDECTCKNKEILHPGGLLTGKVHNISSCIEYRYYKQVQFIERRKYLASVLYKISASLFQNLMFLACTPYLILTDDALHLYQKSSLVLMICLTCTAYPCSYCTYSI